MEYQPLTDLEWQCLEPLFPAPQRRGRGKPHTPWRSVVNSVLWVFITKGKWGAIPQDPAYASKSASHRWFAAWEKNGKLRDLLEAYRKIRALDDMKVPPRRNRLPKQDAVEMDMETGYACCPVNLR